MQLADDKKCKMHRVQTYLVSRLGNKPSVKQVGIDLQKVLNEWSAWAAAEIDTLKQENEELKINLLMAENEFDQIPLGYNRKQWRNTKHDESDPY